MIVWLRHEGNALAGHAFMRVYTERSTEAQIRGVCGRTLPRTRASRHSKWMGFPTCQMCERILEMREAMKRS